MLKIWEKLKKHKLSNDSYNEIEKTFVINLSQNNFQYVIDNYQKIQNKTIMIDCFLISCAYSDNISMIDFIKDKYKINVNCTNDSDNCLIITCSNDPKIEIIKFLINEYKININYLNNKKINCLMKACYYSNNVEIIKYLIVCSKECLNQINIYGDNCLIFASRSKRNNLEVIKFLIEDCKMDASQTRNENVNSLMIACNRKNIECIKYFIEKCKMDTKYTNIANDNCLSYACYNQDINVIKFLIEEIKMNPHHTNINKNNYLMIACQVNSNLEIIKYFIEKVKIEIYCVDKNGSNCLQYACINNNNLIIKYLIETTNLKPIIKLNQYENIAPIITNYEKLNELLYCGTKYYDNDSIFVNIINKINPLKLNKHLCVLFNKNLYDDQYEKFVNNVDDLTCSVAIKFKKKIIQSRRKRCYDFTKQSEPLFKNNNKVYYRSKTVVYDCIDLLNGLDQYDHNEIPTLSVIIPEYIMMEYLQSTYDQMFDINVILKNDFITFLMFIDQYPTRVLSIDLIETEIIMYMNSNKIDINNYLIEMCKKYKFKSMYLYIKQRLLSEQQNKEYIFIFEYICLFF